MDQEYGMDPEAVNDNDVENEDDEEIAHLVHRKTSLASKTSELRPSTTESVLNSAGDYAVRACQLKVRHLRGYYSDSYRLLFNSVVTEASHRFTNDDYTPLAPSQVGASTWTPEEKELFFNVLAKLGRDNLPGIAAVIRSKTETEIHEYIQLLQEGLVQQHLNAPHHRLVGLTEIPAASELSQPCCNSLETASDALAWYQLGWEMRQEKEKHGGLWLLDRQTANLLEGSSSEAEEGVHPDVAQVENEGSNGEEEGGQEDEHAVVFEPSIPDALPAAKLLKLSNWIELSERVFMNAGPPNESDNYRSVADPGERPSITLTALNDFHTLAVSVARRLVHAVLFQTTSRLRATGGSRKGSHVRKVWVRKKDVAAAATVLCMERNSKSFWAKSARRCHLAVYKGRMPTIGMPNRGQRLTYDEVEQLCGVDATFSERVSLNNPYDTVSDDLSTVLEAEGNKSSTGIGWPAKVSATSSMIDDSDTEYQEHTVDDESEDSDTDRSIHSITQETGASFKPSRDPIHPVQEERDELDEHTEQFDRLASHIAEQQLWDMLQQRPPPEIKDEGTVIQKAPATERKRAHELHNWRDWIEYESEWERFAGTRSDVEHPGHAQRTKRRKRSKVAYLAGEPRTGTSDSEVFSNP